LCVGVWASAVLWQLGAPGQLHAQRFRGGFPPPGRPMMSPAFRGAVMPGFRTTPMFRPDPRFRGGMFDPRFDPRFRGGMFDPRFDPRFNRGMMDPRFDPRFR
jgi:hypothetical protein